MRTSVRRGLSALAHRGGFLLLGEATAGSATADTKDPGFSPGTATADVGGGSGAIPLTGAIPLWLVPLTPAGGTST